MKAIRNIVLLVSFFMLFSHLNYGKKRKIYYNLKWKVVVNIDSAAYYRIVKYDRYNNPVGPIRDYYMNDVLQANNDGALKIDSIDDNNSIFIGKSEIYYSTGERESEKIHDNKGGILSSQGWYKSGELRYTTEYKDGLKNGMDIFIMKMEMRKRAFRILIISEKGRPCRIGPMVK